MTTKEKEKQIIVSNVIVKGYVKHTNGRKTLFEFNKEAFEEKELEGVIKGIGRIYK